MADPSRPPPSEKDGSADQSPTPLPSGPTLPGLGGRKLEVPPGIDPRLPRPVRLRVDWRKYSNPPRRQTEVFRAGVFRVLLRLCAWLAAGARFAAGTTWDALLRRNTIERRAQRLRRIFEEAGATFAKIGQQLSMRADMLPYEYIHELEKMLDSGKPFPTEQAIEAIEKAAGRPIKEIFEVFDPEPIASASIACVYQGLLPGGDRVAIKVRRPEIGRQFAADIRGLSWIMRLLELFWFAPGFTRHFVDELRQMLFEELDFAREARFTDLFHRSTHGTEMDFATSPKVYFGLSNSEVLVTEFHTGIFLTELIAAVENEDEAALEALREHDIDPTVVAKRLIWVSRFGGFEALFFHADLHPGNVLVKPGNQLVLIDFGSCGAFTERERVSWRRVLYKQDDGDVGAMVQATLALLEPLPPVAIHEFAARCESLFWQDLYALRSPHSEWWERTTANMWLGFFRLTREFNIPLKLNTLRMIRGSLIADTVALRLYPEMDHHAESRLYLQSAGKRARKRLLKKVPDAILGDAEWVEWEQMFEAGWSALYRAHRFLDSVSIEYSHLQSKLSSFLSSLGQAVYTLCVGIVVATGAVALIRFVRSGPEDAHLVNVAIEVVKHDLFVIFAVLVGLVFVRRWWYRIE